MMSGMRVHRAARWMQEDDDLLRKMAEAGKSLTLMAVKLNRPMAAIRHRAMELGVNIAGTEIGERRKRKRCV
jgi:hypothetical protein